MTRPLDLRDSREWYHAIERAATQHAAGLQLPELGAHIAWAIRTVTGVTTADLSPLHRVGEHIGMAPHTLCGERIPPSLTWFPLSPAIERTMPRCGYCEAGVARAHPEAA